jgi:citrate synthase
MVPDVKKGLDEVVIDKSNVSKIDGETGDLWYAGYHIDDLIDVSTYEEVLFLLWNQRLPDDTELADVEQGLIGSVVTVHRYSTPPVLSKDGTRVQLTL